MIGGADTSCFIKINVDFIGGFMPSNVAAVKDDKNKEKSFESSMF